MDSNKAKLHAILVALEMLVSLPLESVVSLVVESESVLVISWVLHRERQPWRFGYLFHRLGTACLPLPCICYSHVLHEANGIADSLA
ncbi:hypothetical protein GQ457_08G034050 [Hibiscus cannabinus]